jgi:hypothetical protein
MSQKLPAPAPHESRPAPPPTPPANGDHLLTICKQCKCVRKYCTCAYGKPAAVTPERPTYEELTEGLEVLLAYHYGFAESLGKNPETNTIRYARTLLVRAMRKQP